MWVLCTGLQEGQNYSSGRPKLPFFKVTSKTRNNFFLNCKYDGRRMSLQLGVVFGFIANFWSIDGSTVYLVKKQPKMWILWG